MLSSVLGVVLRVVVLGGTAAVAVAEEPAAAPAQEQTMVTPAKTGYAEVNGLKMYYEIYGNGGMPLLLLHGGIIDIPTSFNKVLPQLSKDRQVIAVEQQAHGRTADIDRPLTFEQEADDTAAALAQLGIAKVDVYGYSDGGNVALGLAIRHPGLVRKLAIAGTNANNEGLQPGLVDMFKTAKAEDMPPELRANYEKIAPRPQDFPVLIKKVMDQAVALKGWRQEDLKAIAAPTLIMIGDADIVRPEHAVELHAVIPHSQLAVLPGTDHMQIMERGDWIVSMLETFLAAPMPEASPAQ